VALPASTQLLGYFVDAFEARRGAGPNACYLRDRTGSRALAGSGRTRRWCCLLTAFIECLHEKKVVDSTRLSEAHEQALFLSLASTMKTWDAVAPHARAPLRAHLRFLALDLAGKIVGLGRAGCDFGIRTSLANAPPAWTSPSRRTEPIERLLSDGSTLSAVASRLGVEWHTVVAWFSKGKRPSASSIKLLADELDECGHGGGDDLSVSLFVHYSLNDVVATLGRLCSVEEASDAASVASRLVLCAGTTPARDPLLGFAMSMMLPPTRWLEWALRHGASQDWAEDYERAKADYQAANILESGSDFVHPSKQLARVLGQLPVRRGASPEDHRMRRRFRASLQESELSDDRAMITQFPNRANPSP
jgi:hypothetical protein